MREPSFTPLEVTSQELEGADQLQSPFDELEPAPLAKRAALALMNELRARPEEDGREGKVFGVLVARDARGAVGFLKAFSGMWRGQWVADGFVPPLFDLTARAKLDAESDAAVKPLLEQVRTLEASTAQRALGAEVADTVKRHRLERDALASAHRARRDARRLLRESNPDEADAQSRADKREKRRVAERHSAELETARQAMKRAERRLRAAKRLAAFVSARFVERIIALPTVPNFKGERRSLASLYPGRAPGGAGECAAPKLLAQAAQLGLVPLALAEFWWGDTQPSGRVRGAFVPACRAKCGPLLPFMLEGLAVRAPRRLTSRRHASEQLSVLYEDAFIRVIDKPEGLLTVAGREATHADSVATRLRDATPAHRLDLDTSGVLVLARDPSTLSALQAQFAKRQVRKRYFALVEGPLAPLPNEGVIDLALRLDIDDRPRQMHDALHGKPARTHFHVIERSPSHSRVELRPVTGRTHQLRVHCAHPLGLGAPIVGDRLYGTPGLRLMLHCASLELRHPASGEWLVFQAPMPF